MDMRKHYFETAGFSLSIPYNCAYTRYDRNMLEFVEKLYNLLCFSVRRISLSFLITIMLTPPKRVSASAFRKSPYCK